MSFLRTNYRITGRELDPDAIGDGIILASIGGGAGAAGKRYGGFIMFSGAFSTLASEASTVTGATGYVALSTVSILASFYGCDDPNLDSGYKFLPLMIWCQSISGLTPSDSIDIRPYIMKNSGSVALIRVVRRSSVVMDATQSAFGLNGWYLSDSESISLVIMGFIVSGPST